MKKKTGRMIHMHRKLTEKFQKEWEGKKETSLQSWRMKKRGRKKKKEKERIGMNINLKFLFETREPIFPLETF